MGGIFFGPRLKLCCLLEGNTYLRSSTQREYGTRFRWELLGLPICDQIYLKFSEDLKSLGGFCDVENSPELLNQKGDLNSL